MPTIIINKNSSNLAILTLSEKTTISVPYYLFEFINDTTSAKKYLTAADISGNKLRNNKFIIIDNATELPLIGQLNFKVGSYKYNIYEQASATNLNPTGLKLVDLGRAKVIEADVVLKTYQGSESNFIVYNGN
jgi:hypothetical protein